jgi:hypothetical protein
LIGIPQWGQTLAPGGSRDPQERQFITSPPLSSMAVGQDECEIRLDPQLRSRVYKRWRPVIVTGDFGGHYTRPVMLSAAKHLAADPPDPSLRSG